MILHLWIKKIFGAFLIIAITASGLLWVLGQERKITFTVPPAPLQTNTDTASYSNARAIPPEQNLTRQAAEGLAKELLKKNHEGPRETEQGLEIALNPADALVAMTRAIDQARQQQFNGIDITELRISGKDSPSDRLVYFENLQALIQRTLGSSANQPSILDALASAMVNDPRVLNALIHQHKNAISELRAMPVPASLATLHKKEINLLKKTEVSLDGMASVTADPMRAYLALRVYPQLTDEAITLQKEFTTAIRETQQQANAGFTKRLFGFSAVYAGWPTMETNPLLLKIFPRDKFENKMQLWSEIIKDRILTKLRNQMLSYIQGSAENCPPYLQTIFIGGRDLCPKFVTDWQRFLFGQQPRADAQFRSEIERARNLISEETRRALEALANQPRGDMGIPYEALVVEEPVCYDITNAREQMECFYQKDHARTLNFYSGQQRLTELRETAQRAGEARAIAGKGYLGTEQCAVWSPPDPGTGERVCLQPVITKPAALDAEIHAELEGSSVQRIVNAFDLKALLAAVANMFITQLLNQGFEGVLGLLETPEAPMPPVPPPLAPGTITISANPQIITPGRSSLITWDAPDTTACIASGAWSGSKTAPRGSEIVSPEETATYTLVCTDPYQSQVGPASVTITVFQPRADE
jgi:hypothetical protein